MPPSPSLMFFTHNAQLKYPPCVKNIIPIMHGCLQNDVPFVKCLDCIKRDGRIEKASLLIEDWLLG